MVQRRAHTHYSPLALIARAPALHPEKEVQSLAERILGRAGGGDVGKSIHRYMWTECVNKEC